MILNKQVLYIVAVSFRIVRASDLHRPRHLVGPGDSVADKVAKGRGNGGKGGNGGNPGRGGAGGRAKFKLQGDLAGGGLFDVGVRESTPAITSLTTTSSGGSAPTLVNADDLATILVADYEEEKSGVVAIIALDEKTQDVNGIVERQGKKTKFSQKKGKRAEAFDAPKWEPPAWACHVNHEQELAGKKSSRHLLDGLRQDDGHDHGHDAHDHDDHDDHEREHEGHDHPHIDLADITKGLRGSSIRLGKRRRLQGLGYGYQVDLFIEIDTTLCGNNDEAGTCAEGTIGPDTLNYINSIFAGANSIYEEEIDTHLNILHIEVNNNYDNDPNPGEALGTMRNLYANSNTWHYAGTDLHHAFIGREIGGGVAYVEAICDPSYGFGVSAGITGTYQDMSAPAVWDMVVFMHELGHNFGSGHTHQGYVGPVDTCGSGNGCPAGLPLPNSATIMSYCHICPGGMSNIDYTFGGKYSGTGNRTDSTSYTNSPLAGDISTDPRRVSAKMYSHVSGSLCTDIPAPTGPTTSPTTGAPTRPNPTQNPTTADPTGVPTTANPTTAPTPCEGKDVKVNILTDNYPAETSWTIKNLCDGTQALAGGPYSAAGTLHEDDYCLPESRYEFTITDAWGDGICCSYGSGEYEVLMEGDVVASGGAFGSSETSPAFGTSCPVAPTTPPPTNTPTTPSPTTTQPTKNPTENPTTTQPTKNPTENPTTTQPTKNPTENPTTTQPTKTPTQNPTKQPTYEHKSCSQSLVKIDVFTDAYPEETAWTLKNLCDGTEIFSHAGVMGANRLHEGTLCLPEAQYEFTITDTWSDGQVDGYYRVEYEGNQVAYGQSYGYSEMTHFGSCP